jgi:excisionase family DNA binding protein
VAGNYEKKCVSMIDETSTANGSAKCYVSFKSELGRVPLCERTFRDLIRRGIIPSYKMGLRRILLVSEEVDRAIEARFRREAALPS